MKNDSLVIATTIAMSNVSLLHISDTHFGQPKNRGAQARIVGALTQAVHQHVKDVEHPPQLCVFSGDLAHSATRAQYDACAKWLEELMEPLNGCKLFIVPGNHDVKRPKASSRLVKELRNAHYAEESYRINHAQFAQAPHLDEFVAWHEELKNLSSLEIVSDWSTSRLLCHQKIDIDNIPTNLIGINSAILSCGNDDRGKLAADIDELNNSLALTRADEELIVATSHHPIGVAAGEGQDTGWFVNWNNAELEKLLLQSTGPHMYLHGHLHEATGTTVGMSSGQHLTLFGAGAAYNTDRPMKFAFYEIDLAGRIIKPQTYFYRERAGKWTEDPETSQPVGAVLPQHTDNRASISYAHSCSAARAVFSQAFLEHDRPGHTLTEVRYECRMLENGDGLVRNTLCLKPTGEEPVQFFKYEIDAQGQDIPSVGYVEELDFQIRDLSGKDATYLVISNEPNFKELCIFFLPRMESETDSRTIEITFRWPGFVNEFVRGGKVRLDWHSKASNQSETADLTLCMQFPACYDNVGCKIVGQISDHATNNMSIESDGCKTWTYRVENASLRGGAKYGLEFVDESTT